MNKDKAFILLLDKANLTELEILTEVEQVENEMKGLITKEGALLVVLKKHKINVKEALDEGEENKYDEICNIKVSDIKDPMKGINLQGKIKYINKITNFTTKNGTTSKVGSFVLIDDSGEIKVTLWGDKVDFLSIKGFEKEAEIKLYNGYTRINNYNNESKTEIHLGKNSKIDIIKNKS